jgi:predicted ATPase
MTSAKPKLKTQQEPNLSKLKKLELSNFKAFGEDISVAFRPITLIFGQNSSGKSSIIHSLLHMHQLLMVGEGVTPHNISFTKLGGDSVDLGGYPHYLYQHDSSKTLKMRLSFERQRYDSRFNSYFAEPSSTEVVLKQTIQYESKTLLNTTSVQLFDQPLYSVKMNLSRLGRYEAGAVTQDVDAHQYIIEQLYPLFTTIVDDIRDQVVQDIPEHERILHPVLLAFRDFASSNHVVFAEQVTSLVNELLGSSLPQPDAYDRIDFNHKAQHNDSFPYHSARQIAHMYSKVLRSENCRQLVFDLLNTSEVIKERVNATHVTKTFKKHVNMLGFLKDDDGFVTTLTDASCAEFLNSLRYIGPLREIPKRFFNQPVTRSTQLVDSANAWKKLATEERLRNHINEQFVNLKMGYTLQIHANENSYTFEKKELDAFLETITSMEAIDSDGLQLLISEFKNKRISPPIQLFVELLDKHSQTVVSHRDVGIGISQVLPILVQCSSETNATICIEQPELHLHPRLQGDLADVFIRTSIGSEQNNTYVIETHSEHIIRRLMRRVREGKISKDDISIVYVEPGPNGSAVTHLHLDDDGDLVDEWPNGFFEEGFRDNMAGR